MRQTNSSSHAALPSNIIAKGSSPLKSATSNARLQSVLTQANRNPSLYNLRRKNELIHKIALENSKNMGRSDFVM